jgi:hypothetical protein
LIAYSQQAQARRVKELIDQGVFHEVFQGYNVANVAGLDAAQVRNQHWGRLGAVRFPPKIAAMIGCAKGILGLEKSHSSFMSYLSTFRFPAAVIRSQSEVTAFWTDFKAVQTEFRRVQMPFFASLTSLLHLLMTLGFECAKPDSVVVGSAVRLGIVPQPRNPRSPNDWTRRTVIETMQMYCSSRNMRVAELDLYLLIYGGQTSATHCVSSQFYSSPSASA